MNKTFLGKKENDAEFMIELWETQHNMNKRITRDLNFLYLLSFIQSMVIVILLLK